MPPALLPPIRRHHPQPRPATMADAAAAGATPLLHGLPEEIVLWEILVRLDPKSLLRCRAVRRAWRCATSTRRFLLAHHARQPASPIFSSDGCRSILAFDRRDPAAAQLHTVARLDNPVILASCDGLLVLSWSDRRACLTVCNPATREHASLGGILPWDFTVVGMYPHRPTCEYRLLLQRRGGRGSNQLGCYIFVLGSGQTPRYIGWPETAPLKCFETPALVHSLHLFPFKTLFAAKKIWVFDTMAESFRKMRAPVDPPSGDLFEMDDTLGIHGRNDATDYEIVTIWVLQDYEGEVWELKYRIKLPVADIREQFEDNGKGWGLDVVSRDGDVLLLVHSGGWLLQVYSDGKLIDSFNCGHTDLRMYRYRLKQSLVQHTFFPALENYAVNSPLFI